jgi:hypothetical protein
VCSHDSVTFGLERDSPFSGTHRSGHKQGIAAERITNGLSGGKPTAIVPSVIDLVTRFQIFRRYLSLHEQWCIIASLQGRVNKADGELWRSGDQSFLL